MLPLSYAKYSPLLRNVTIPFARVSRGRFYHVAARHGVEKDSRVWPISPTIAVESEERSIVREAGLSRSSLSSISPVVFIGHPRPPRLPLCSFFIVFRAFRFIAWRMKKRVPPSVLSGFPRRSNSMLVAEDNGSEWTLMDSLSPLTHANDRAIARTRDPREPNGVRRRTLLNCACTRDEARSAVATRNSVRRKRSPQETLLVSGLIYGARRRRLTKEIFRADLPRRILNGPFMTEPTRSTPSAGRLANAR